MPDPLPLRDILIPANVGRRFRFDTDGEDCEIVRTSLGIGYFWTEPEDRIHELVASPCRSVLYDAPVTLLDAPAPDAESVTVEATVAITPDGDYAIVGKSGWTPEQCREDFENWIYDDGETFYEPGGNGQVKHIDMVRLTARITPPRVTTTPAEVRSVEVEG